jgi:hypothetical protein
MPPIQPLVCKVKVKLLTLFKKIFYKQIKIRFPKIKNYKESYEVIKKCPKMIGYKKAQKTF